MSASATQGGHENETQNEPYISYVQAIYSLTEKFFAAHRLEVPVRQESSPQVPPSPGIFDKDPWKFLACPARSST